MRKGFFLPKIKGETKMTIKFAQENRENQLPRLQELQRGFHMISDIQQADGTWKQIIMTNRGGKIFRYLAPDKKTILKQETQSFAVSKDGKRVDANADFWNPDTGEALQDRGTRRPSLQQLQRGIPMADKMMSEKRMPDGRWYQVWETAKGKQVKILSPDKKKTVHQYSPAVASSKKNYRRAVEERIQPVPEPVSEPITQTPQLPDLSMMTLSKIASLIKRDWKNVNFGAKPYLDAMFSLNAITDNFYQDSGSSIVAYFLANATTYKGELAKAIKKELNKRLKAYYKR